ncbi:cytochrome P450 [Gonapodya prolifera JEL478]|uniref:Cytochrome P450 n=1 Tax=Gonapodya prolifera (strain JEL478) TaxID=1344416 RepID=A0A139AZ51_GONPJ|nr:cytochrome P450 [Gonapodya prolifera JEL478]|eukprot:KXS22028.1 cytochrome P450 [Gonapodya prolifera JEL478]
MRGGDNLKYIKAWDDLLGSAGLATLLELLAGQWAASRLDEKWETLRLYPAAVNGAQCMATEDWDYTYTGTDGQTKLILFKANDFIHNGIFASQRYAPNWTKRDPNSIDEWNPQWFLDDVNGGGNTAFSQAPFGGGARKCLGEKLAYLEGRTILSELLRKYKIVPAEGWKPIMLSTAGVRVHFVPLS